MLTRDELVDLYRTLKDRSVLSVYLDVDHHDPARKGHWRNQLRTQLSNCRKTLTEDTEAEFQEAAGHIEDALRPYDNHFVPNRGWVGFATRDRLWHAEELPVSVADRARWDRGIQAAPYVKVLGQHRPVWAALVDQVRARVFRYADGVLTEMEGLTADRYLGDLSDSGVSKSASRTSGFRGETSTDLAQRLLDRQSGEMARDLVQRLTQGAGDDGLVILGGTTEMVARVHALLPGSLTARIRDDVSLHVEMAPHEVRAALERDTAALTEDLHARLVDQVLEAGRGKGAGVRGVQSVRKALTENRVDRLLLSRGFVGGHPEVANELVGLALAQGGDLEEVNGPPGVRLDREVEGVAARLRF